MRGEGGRIWLLGALLAVVGGCTNGQVSSDSAPLAKPSAPDTVWEEIAQRALLPSDALASLELAGQQTYGSSDDSFEPEECSRFAELDETYGTAETTWGIGYRRPPSGAVGESLVGNSIVVWESSEVAERRVLDAVEILGPCRRETIAHNFEIGTEDPIELRDAVVLDLELPAIPGVVVAGYRVRLSVDVGGLGHFVYYDFAYLAHDHAISIVDVASSVRPLETSERDRLLQAAAAQLVGAQP